MSKKTTPTKKSSAKKAPAKKKQPARQAWSIYDYVPAWLVTLIALALTYIAFSLAIDSGSLIHYALGFYFLYAVVEHGKVAYHSFRSSNDNKAKAKPPRRTR